MVKGRVGVAGRAIGAVHEGAAAFGAHFMGAYNVVIASSMMTNVLQTDVPEEYRGEMAEMGWESSFNRLKAYLA